MCTVLVTVLLLKTMRWLLGIYLHFIKPFHFIKPSYKTRRNVA